MGRKGLSSHQGGSYWHTHNIWLFEVYSWGRLYVIVDSFVTLSLRDPLIWLEIIQCLLRWEAHFVCIQPLIEHMYGGFMVPPENKERAELCVSAM